MDFFLQKKHFTHLVLFATVGLPFMCHFSYRRVFRWPCRCWSGTKFSELVAPSQWRQLTREFEPISMKIGDVGRRWSIDWLIDWFPCDFSRVPTAWRCLFLIKVRGSAWNKGILLCHNAHMGQIWEAPPRNFWVLLMGLAVFLPEIRGWKII